MAPLPSTLITNLSILLPKANSSKLHTGSHASHKRAIHCLSLLWFSRPPLYGPFLMRHKHIMFHVFRKTPFSSPCSKPAAPCTGRVCGKNCAVPHLSYLVSSFPLKMLIPTLQGSFFSHSHNYHILTGSVTMSALTLLDLPFNDIWHSRHVFLFELLDFNIVLRFTLPHSLGIFGDSDLPLC